jgi:peroxiredoxin
MVQQIEKMAKVLIIPRFFRIFAAIFIKLKKQYMNKKAFLTVITMLMTITMQAQSTQQDMDDMYATELLKAGTIAPDFSMKTPDGETIQLSEYAKGKTIVLDFWASWCPDCRKDAPEVVRLYEKYHQYGIEFIGISMDTDVEAWKKTIEKFGITYPQASELKKFKETDIAKAYGVKWIPSIVVVGPDGQVKLSTVLTTKLDNYLKELTTDAQ